MSLAHNHWFKLYPPIQIPTDINTASVSYYRGLPKYMKSRISLILRSAQSCTPYSISYWTPHAD
jgi:hypothetical protein